MGGGGGATLETLEMGAEEFGEVGGGASGACLMHFNAMRLSGSASMM